jgi:hypothetical protein
MMALFTLLPPVARAAACSAESGTGRVPVLELYTSEGCDSCPPTDRWISNLALRGLSSGQLVILAFHVDYWNYLGWNDPYARPEFSARQRAASRRSDASLIYTPQLLLNGRDYRRGISKDTFSDDIAALNRSRPRARIILKTDVDPTGVLMIRGSAYIHDPAERNGARAYVAVYENGVVNDVKAGENRGRRLHHDFVVRSFAGPLSIGSDGMATFDQRLALDSRWNLRDLGITAFVQNERNGDVLQALAIPQCGAMASLR